MRKKVLQLISIGCILFIAIHADAQEKSDSIHFGDINWVKTNDPVVRYYQIPSSQKSDKKKDSVTVKVLGTLNERRQLITSPFDALAFETFHGMEEKKYAINDLIETSLQELTQGMPKDGTAYILYQKSSRILELPAFSLRIFFKDSVDVTLQKNEVVAIAKLQYTDSIKYHSKEEEEKRYIEDTGDISWKALLNVSPFPAVAEAFIKKEFINDNDIPAIVKKIEQSKLISSVEYPRAMKFSRLTEMDQLYQVPFILKFNMSDMDDDFGSYSSNPPRLTAQ
jgi:hypothetical protein